MIAFKQHFLLVTFHKQWKCYLNKTLDLIGYFHRTAQNGHNFTGFETFHRIRKKNCRSWAEFQVVINTVSIRESYLFSSFIYRRTFYPRDHALELGNPIPEKPLIFLKPSSSYVQEGEAIKVSLLLKQNYLIHIQKFCIFHCLDQERGPRAYLGNLTFRTDFSCQIPDVK